MIAWHQMFVSLAFHQNCHALTNHGNLLTLPAFLLVSLLQAPTASYLDIVDSRSKHLSLRSEAEDLTI